MAENHHLAAITSSRLQVEHDPQWHAASLRYFARDSTFTRMVGAVTGLNVPGELSAVHLGEATQPVTMLAWRSPTETTLVTRDAALVGSLEAAAAALNDGCVVDQRGGLLILRARGAVAELTARKAGHGVMPALGESRRARFAEVPVSMVKVQDEEILLIVDRIYAPHLMASIRASAPDF